MMVRRMGCDQFVNSEIALRRWVCVFRIMDLWLSSENQSGSATHEQECNQVTFDLVYRVKIAMRYHLVW